MRTNTNKQMTIKYTVLIWHNNKGKEGKKLKSHLLKFLSNFTSKANS